MTIAGTTVRIGAVGEEQVLGRQGVVSGGEHEPGPLVAIT